MRHVRYSWIIMACILVLLMNGFFVYAAGEAKNPVVLHFATTHPATSSMGPVLYAMKNWVEERTNGEIEIIVHAYGELGTSERDYVDAMMGGDLDGATIMPSILTAYGDNYFELWDLPGVFKTAEQRSAFAYPYADYMDVLRELIQKKFGIVLLGPGGTGYTPGSTRQIISNRPIRRLDDLKGFKMRIMETPIQLAVYKALGCTPIVVPYGECYTALQNKMVDGMMHPASLGMNQGFFDYCKYFTHFSPEGPGTMAIFMSIKAWNKLTPEQQEIMKEAAGPLAQEAQYCNNLIADREAEKKLVSEFEVEIIDWPQEEIDKVQKILLADKEIQKYYEHVREIWNPYLSYDIFDAVNDPWKYGGKKMEFKYFTPETWKMPEGVK